MKIQLHQHQLTHPFAYCLRHAGTLMLGLALAGPAADAFLLQDESQFAVSPFAATARADEKDDEKPAEKTAVPPELVGDWLLTKLLDQKIEKSAESPDLSVTAEGKVSGTTGVNRFGGMIAAKTPPLFGPLFTTRRAGEPDAMKIEANYVKALGKVASTKTQDDQLLLLDADKKVLLTFQRKKKTDE